MADWDFSEFTDAQLSTLQTNILAKINSLLTGTQEGELDGMKFKDMSLNDLRELQAAVNGEVRLRADDTGGLIAVEFEEPEA